MSTLRVCRPGLGLNSPARPLPKAAPLSHRLNPLRLLVCTSASASPSPAPRPASSPKTAAQATQAGQDLFSGAMAAAPGPSPETSSVTVTGTGAGVSTSAAADRKAMLHEALKQLSEEGLETAAEKYNLHEELFAEIDFARVNAFSPDPFGGNPAAVVYLPYMPAEEWLQRVAAEFNLSETAYVVRRRTPASKGPLQRAADGSGLEAVSATGSPRPLRGNEFDLRWFTPSMEVRLCGHATLASAHLIFTAGLLEPGCDSIVFHTLSGALTARTVPPEASPLYAHALGKKHNPAPSTGDGAETFLEGASAETKGKEEGRGPGKGAGGAEGGRKKPKGRGIVELQFPVLPLAPVEPAEWPALEDALRLPEGSLVWAGRNSLHYILAEVRTAEEVLEAQPDFPAVAHLPALGVILTAPCSGGVAAQGEKGATGVHARPELQRADFVARFFAPQAGVDEDPVTGSAFCSLGPHWSQKLGKQELLGFQASARGGEVAVLVDEGAWQVRLQGWAVMVQAGVLLNTTGPVTA